MYIKIIGIWNSTLNIFLLFLIFSCEENTANADLDLYLKESVFYDKNTNLKYTGFVNSFYNNGKKKESGQLLNGQKMDYGSIGLLQEIRKVKKTI